jgi:cytoskeletal protein CcmA (bactofilin family)
MWGAPKKRKVTINSLIGPGTEITGNVVFSGGLHIDGKIEGNVSAAEDASMAILTLSEQGSIKGDVRVPHVILNGIVEGNVYAAEKAELEVNARINGNLYYNLIEMAMGAEVNGSLIRSTEMPPITVDPPTPPRIVAKDPNKLTKPSVAERLASNRTAPVAKVSKEPQSKE